MTVLHVVSTSGGKDSAATLLLALERFGRERVIPIFCDTGNEHEATYAYLGYLEQALDIQIRRLRANFDEEIAAKRMFIARDRRTGRQYRRVPKTDRAGNPVWLRDKAGQIVMRPVNEQDPSGDDTGRIVGMEPVQRMGWDSGRRVRWSNEAKRRALAALHPSGNPFLDLCLWKGRFPSRKAQFCTQELKRDLAVAFQLDLAEAGHRVVSWQGVRRDESLNRRHVKTFERIGPRMFTVRPIADWTAQQVFDFCASRGLQPNPLYRQGMNRVGCMPCINVSKPELREIAVRFPAHLHRIAAWEQQVSATAKRGGSTFMADAHDGKDRRQVFADLNVWARVEWSKTTRGGRQYDLLADDTPSACASAYGLCE